MAPSTTGSTTILDHASSEPSAFSMKGMDSGGDGGRGGKRPMPHIDDITAVSLGFDATAPMEWLIQKAETYLNQAISLKSFGRPEVALKDYIRTTIILDDMIKRNRGWVMLQSDNKGQSDRYAKLVLRARGLKDEFEKVKADIVADNARTGVMPTAHYHHMNGINGEAGGDRGAGAQNVTTAGSLTNGAGASKEAASANGHTVPALVPEKPPPAPKAKPMIHPKPQALHGNVIKPSMGNVTVGSKTAQDLAQRFANLRATTANGSAPLTQDPRIRTQPIIPPRPAHSPVAGKQPRLDTSAAAALPELPKVPDAIYSPARGTVSSEAASLPSSTPRGIFSRTNSTASFTPSRNTRSPPPPNDYFVPAQSFGAIPGLPATMNTAKIPLPDGETISVETLVKCMQAGTRSMSILLIDVRTKEDFKEGHIMSQATICIEPEILMRRDISAIEISDSMVLASTAEQALFDRRHSFDVIVFYDAMSDKIPSQATATTREQKALLGLYRALTLFDFGPEEQQKPRLLEGGLEAWVSVMGSASLEKAQSSVLPPSVNPLANPMATRLAAIRSRTPVGARKKFWTPPIENAEAQKWREALEDKNAFSPVRTTEDFLRRYPAISSVQESMSSPAMHAPDGLYSTVPSPPTRPAPALPRSSHSGLDDADTFAAKMADAGSSQVQRLRPGLVNPHNWCYANSTLQALFSTAGFSRELWTGDFLNTYRVPRKKNELIDQPQIMSRCLQSLFYVLHDAKVPTVDTRVVMNFVNYVHKRNPDGTFKPAGDTFGSPMQQDMHEFLEFLLQNLHNETNLHRDQVPGDKEDLRFTDDPRPFADCAMEYWNQYRRFNDSLVSRYFTYQVARLTKCPNCGQEIRRMENANALLLTVLTADGQTLQDLLADYLRDQDLIGLNCEKCKQANIPWTSKLARLPDRFIIVLTRFSQAGEGFGKNQRLVSFPVDQLNLAPFFIPGPYPNDRQFNPTATYELYAAVHHHGKDIRTGHYTACVRSSPGSSEWLYASDTQISRMPDVSDGNGRRMLMGDNTKQPYVLFYQRQGSV